MLKPKRSIRKEKKDVFKLYSERLINKLEKKMLDLEKEVDKRKQIERELRQISESQAVLLKEVNHRVRNNLTAIIGMLYNEESNAEKIGKPEVRQLFHNLTIRIQGLSTVHKMLADSGWRSLRISQLCEEVIKATMKSLHATKQILLKISPSDIQIGSDKAQYLALIVNELFTNSLRYALQDRDKVTVEIKIIEKDGNVIFRYSDDGPGYPEEMIKGDYSKIGTGFDLLSGTVRHSLSGKIELSNDNGAVTKIVFKKAQ